MGLLSQYKGDVFILVSTLVPIPAVYQVIKINLALFWSQTRLYLYSCYGDIYREFNSHGIICQIWRDLNILPLKIACAFLSFCWKFYIVLKTTLSPTIYIFQGCIIVNCYKLSSFFWERRMAMGMFIPPEQPLFELAEDYRHPSATCRRIEKR